MHTSQDIIINVDDAPEEGELDGEHFGAFYKVLTPAMRGLGGSLGVVLNRVPPGRTACPFHTHQFEDEVFFIVSGTGTLRYDDKIHPLRAGDCVSCPAGTGKAHQIANTGEDELTYLAMGRRDPNEVCTYPDSGKVMVRSLGAVGRLERTEYMDSEPDVPRIFSLAADT